MSRMQLTTARNRARLPPNNGEGVTAARRIGASKVSTAHQAHTGACPAVQLELRVTVGYRPNAARS